MSRQPKEEQLIVGAEPRVDLLPPEVLKARAAKATRRRLGFGVIASVIVVVLGVGATFALNVQASIDLLSAQARTADLILEQGEYSEVTKVQYHLDLATAAQQVGASTEIAWKSYLEQVQATLPASVTIDTVTIDSASPVALYAQPTAPLQGARMATVSFSAKSSVLPDVPAWLRSLATLPGFADALPGSVTLDETTGVYTASITMHVNDKAFSGRFAPVVPEDEAAADAGADTADAAASGEGE
jgi:Tfp pilus assembly protein PilN